MPLLPPTEEEGQRSWLRLMWRQRQQFQAMSAACTVFLGSGVRLAWTIFDTPAGKFLNNSSSTQHLMMSWFLGVALGALLAAICVQRLSKNVAYTCSGLLLLIAGLFSIGLAQQFSGAYYSSVSVGAAYGLCQVQSAYTASELAHHSIRGLLLSGERLFLWLGVCLQLLCTRLWYALEPQDRSHALHIDQLHGIVLAGLGLLAVLLALMQRLESLELLQLQQQQQREENIKQTELLRLREPSSTQLTLDDSLLEAAAAPAARASLHSARRELGVLAVLLLLRCLAAAPLSLPYLRAYLSLSWQALDCELNCLHWLAIGGLLGTLLGALLVDWQGRRKLCWLSLFVGGIVVFMLGGIFEHLEWTKQIQYDLNLQPFALLMLLFELLVALGVAVPALVYSAEAFARPHKAKSLAGLLICEQALQLALLLLTFGQRLSYAVFFFSCGLLSFALGLLVFMFLPETRQLPLPECLRKFKTCA